MDLEGKEEYEMNEIVLLIVDFESISFILKRFTKPPSIMEPISPKYLHLYLPICLGNNNSRYIQLYNLSPCGQLTTIRKKHS